MALAGCDYDRRWPARRCLHLSYNFPHDIIASGDGHERDAGYAYIIAVSHVVNHSGAFVHSDIVA